MTPRPAHPADDLATALAARLFHLTLVMAQRTHAVSSRLTRRPRVPVPLRTGQLASPGQAVYRVLDLGPDLAPQRRQPPGQGRLHNYLHLQGDPDGVPGSYRLVHFWSVPLPHDPEATAAFDRAERELGGWGWRTRRVDQPRGDLHLRANYRRFQLIVTWDARERVLAGHTLGPPARFADPEDARAHAPAPGHGNRVLLHLTPSLHPR
ncbi:hypothetical protein [Streptomyces sp. NPDC005438]|uniref:hypothetical protein n=1 Tax=Streptomyces sp. NPDC005438 TaxID=3156880 RepID=UPI0033A10EBF